MTRNAGAGAVSEPGFERLDAAGSRWRVSNPAVLATLRGHLVYTVKQGAKKVAEGTIPVKVGPQDSAEYPIPGEPTKPGKTLKYEVKLEAAY